MTDPHPQSPASDPATSAPWLEKKMGSEKPMGSQNPMRSISHYACPAGIGFETFLDRVAAAGFNAVALTQRSVDELPVDQLCRALQSRSMGVSSVNSAGYFLYADPDAQATQTAENARLITLAAAVGAHGLNVIVGGIGRLPPYRRPIEARQAATVALRGLADQAKAAGVALLVEPIHPAGIHDKGCFNTVAQVRNAIHGLNTVSLTIDLFHSWWDPDLDAVLGDPMAPVGLIQIADVTLAEGGNADGAAVIRAMPGTGLVDIPGLVARAHIGHPSAPLELEVFADRLPEPAGDGALDRILAAAGPFLMSDARTVET